MKFTFKFCAVIITGILFSCVAPQFKILPTGDKFSDSNAPYGFVGKNNRLSTKSSKGGTHIDEKGVYLDPFVFKNNKSNSIKSVGFYVAHYSFELSDGFRPINEIIFLTDKGYRIKANVKPIDSEFNIGTWNKVSKEFDSTFNEFGVTNILLRDFMLLASSKWVEVKINGQKRTQIYNREEVLLSFMNNLNAFYKNKVLN